MDQIVTHQGNNDSEQKKIDEFIRVEGQRIYNKNGFFRDLSRLMEKADFQAFHEKYLADWSDIEVTMMYMKLYTDIKSKYPQSFERPASKELALFITSKVIGNNETRRFLIEKFTEFKKGLEGAPLCLSK